MSDSAKEYWKETVSQCLDEIGVKLTDEQLTSFANDMQIAHDCFSETFSPAAQHIGASQSTIIELQKELEREQRKQFCKECRGRGIYILPGPIHASYHDCTECKGKGFTYV